MEKGKEGLDKAYDDTVNRIENQEQGICELAKNVLFWVVYAKRPLTTEELRHALAVEPGTCRLDEMNLCPVNDMVSSCAGLVIVDSNIIRLVHYTTQEYFQRHGLKSFEDVQRDTIAKSCLTYLSYDMFADGYLTDLYVEFDPESDPESDLYVESDLESDLEFDLESRLHQNAFFKYAAQNWAYHIQGAQQSVGDLALKLLMDDKKASASSKVLLSEYDSKFCGMHLVAYFGLNDIMVKLLEEKDPDTKDSFGRTPLSYAAEKGNARVVELLFDYDVDVCSECNKKSTPFSQAIEGGSAAVVQIFLAKGVKPDHRYIFVSIQLLVNKSITDG
jgi:Ankyrin repeats (3 copies)